MWMAPYHHTIKYPTALPVAAVQDCNRQAGRDVSLKQNLNMLAISTTHLHSCRISHRVDLQLCKPAMLIALHTLLHRPSFVQPILFPFL
jgi:hypothetical protein